MSISDAVSRVGRAIVEALPPSFLALAVLNVIFLGVVLWFLDDQLDQRMKLATQILDRCMDHLGH